MYACMRVCVCVCACACSVHGVFVNVSPKAEQDAAPQHEDGGPPAQPVAPVELMVGLQYCAVQELDGVENQSAGLNHH